MPIVYDAAEDVRQRIDFSVPVTEYDDQEIVSGLIDSAAEICAIMDQIADHMSGDDIRDVAWLNRAKAARRYKKQHIVRLRAEAQRRGMPEVLPDYADRETAERERRERADDELHAAQVRAAEAKRQAADARRLAALAVTISPEEREIERTAKTERLRMNLEAEKRRDAAKAELFMVAARKCLTREQRQAIWDCAVEMFPNHEALRARVPSHELTGA